MKSGLPKVTEYNQVLETNKFKEMENFSNRFIDSCKNILGQYAKKWAGDPLHQWSRQWEYPFVCSRIMSATDGAESPKILDAGSGMTFFPFYLASRIGNARIYCCDSDKSLEPLYSAINKNKKNAIDFSSADLRSLPYQDNMFDVVYCISVLEHTKDYEVIIDDFYRILKPNGKLIITFDVSLDGSRDISPERADRLLASLQKRFASDVVADDASMAAINNLDIFTTLTAEKIDSALLPWKYSKFIYQIQAILAGKKFGHWPPKLAVYCLSLTKLSSPVVY